MVSTSGIAARRGALHTSHRCVELWVSTLFYSVAFCLSCEHQKESEYSSKGSNRTASCNRFDLLVAQ